MSVMEHQLVRFRIQQEDPQHVPLIQVPWKRTNEALTIARDVKKSARTLTFWYVNDSSVPSTIASVDFRVLPALFGGNITVAPFRVVMAYPQETACHPKGLGVLATRSVILVKRGGCSFGVKAKSVQEVGGIGMLLINSDESLIPLMSDPKELDGVTIWGASIGLQNGTLIQTVLERNKNLPSLVKIIPTTSTTTSPTNTP